MIYYCRRFLYGFVHSRCQCSGCHCHSVTMDLLSPCNRQKHQPSASVEDHPSIFIQIHRRNCNEQPDAFHFIGRRQREPVWSSFVCQQKQIIVFVDNPIPQPSGSSPKSSHGHMLFIECVDRRGANILPWSDRDMQLIVRMMKSDSWITVNRWLEDVERNYYRPDMKTVRESVLVDPLRPAKMQIDFPCGRRRMDPVSHCRLGYVPDFWIWILGARLVLKPDDVFKVSG